MTHSRLTSLLFAATTVVCLSVTVAAAADGTGSTQHASAAPQASGPRDQSAAPVRLTLDDAIRQATATSHRLGELRARQAATRAVVDQRGAAQKPIVTAQLGYQRTNHVEEFGFPTPDGGLRLIYPDVPDNYRTRIELQWPIYTGGRLQALERAARAEAEFSGQELATARADL